MGLIGETGIKPVDPASIPQRRLYRRDHARRRARNLRLRRGRGAEVAAAVNGAAAVGYRHFDCASEANGT